jgi:hypothetical protein
MILMKSAFVSWIHEGLEDPSGLAGHILRLWSLEIMGTNTLCAVQKH